MVDQSDERIVDKRAASRMQDGEGQDVPPTEGAEGAAELETEREKADTYYKNWQRTAADFINFKRRVEQERGEMARLTSAALVINMLPVYDDLDRAVASVDTTLAGLNWVQGVVNIHQKFNRLLEAMGVAEIAAENESFDPARHEAVGRQPGEEGKVLHVVQKGYELQGKVIRPAMVIVGEAADG
ncbi:MAG: nucleotide exchange factor GrpE [Chloroflexi bacterium]|nr:nucleotide exchange factor GrpE [Dehalococcoidia bacterium]MCO5202183.1 nucleotide exchange factor GrpE [Chloroflexota bacterium]MCZ7577374.1 nucleotide exchange factor GrpE [Dehalococcoidia bacterium]